MASLHDNNRVTYTSGAGLNATTAKALSNTDLERLALSTTLGITGTNLAKKSTNDLRILNGQRARDYS